MIKGCMGKMAFIDLSSGETKDEIPGEELYHDFLGGYGIGAKIIFSRQKPGVDPLGPDNTLGFVTGLLTGTPTPFSGRYTIVGKSPLTQTWGDANSGGDFGPYLKFAGYDAVFFTGIADRPVYLLILDGKLELKDASDIWGKDTYETEDILKAKHGRDARVACIGQAGEKLSLISGVITNKGRAAARSGLGAVMGSKKLKAVVVKGKAQVPIAEIEQVKKLRRKYLPKIRSHPAGIELSTTGTAGSTGRNAHNGRSPVKNWAGIGTKDYPNPKPAAIAGQVVFDHQERKYGCWGCPVACSAIMRAGAEYDYEAGAHRPEYETACVFGTTCLNDNYESIIMANDICNRYGLDTMSAGSTIAFAIDCYENGLITKGDTDGIELNWGNHQAIIAMLKKLARREGFGAILADGVKKAADVIGRGAENYAIHVGGQEIPMHDPKSFPGFGLAYIIDATPGRHTQYGNEYKVPGAEHRRGNVIIQAYSSAGLCLFSYFVTDEEPIIATDFLSAVTGYTYDYGELFTIGERIANTRQAFNFREGINPLERRLPDRVLGIPPQVEGPNAGVTIDFNPVIKEYLQAMDWDLATAKPSRKKLQELGLEEVNAVLWP